jgi:hypothetical protein
MRYLLSLTVLLAAPALAQGDPSAEVSEERLRSDVEDLVSFGTRHTLSDPDDPVRGIGAARRWATAEFEATSQACGGCLEIIHPERMVTGDRIPDPALIQNVVAIQLGSERPEEVVIVQAHIDSRVTDEMDAMSDAPGANDNASGSALVLEAARVLSQRQYPTTVVYALLSGEEQGLFGGELFADYALEQGWTVKAVLNNDVVGGSCGSDGVCDDRHVRVFSEGVRADANEATRSAMRSRGGANDSPSRNISRWLDELAAEYDDGLDVRQTWRSDRMGRGGDHLPFLDRGLPAVRFSVAIEDYEHQHQDLRVEDGVTFGDTVDEMDFPYLAKVTQLNVQALDRLARAPMPPRFTIDGEFRKDIFLLIEQQQGAVEYNLYYRATDARDWEWRGSVDRSMLPEERRDGPIDVWISPERGDDWIVGVSSVAADGTESPVASGVPGGAFYPISD